jgi:oxygen-independent coproporphyrinogen-3 oxidase
MEADIDAAAALLPQHISAYNLTLKPGHPLFSHLPDDDQCADLYELGIRLLQDRGYAQYEISNYARAGFPSLHNLLYWSGGDYLGVGPSAASRFLWEGRFHHRKQLSDLRQYLGQAEFPGPVFEPTTWGQTVLEATFLELRTNQGVKLDTFASRYGYDLRSARRYAYYRDLDLLQESDGWLKLSPKGTLLADTITSDLVDVEPTAEAAVV